MADEPDDTPPVDEEQAKAQLFVDLGNVVGVLTDGGVLLTPQASFCLLTIGYGILFASRMPHEDMVGLNREAWHMAKELTPVILRAFQATQDDEGEPH